MPPRKAESEEKKGKRQSPAFESVMAEIEKAYGPTAIRPLRTSDPRRLPSGIFNLDWCIGGGLPVNRLSEIYGHKACFKTTTALLAAVEYQRRCGNCFALLELCECGKTDDSKIVVFNDIEHALDEDHAARLGVKPERLYLLRPPHGEAACEYTERLVKAPEVGMVIIDSLAALNSEIEMDSGYFDTMSRGLRAKLIARMCRALIHHLDDPEHPRVAIMLNHLLPDQKNPGAEYLPGGETQKYLSSLVLKVWASKRERIEFDKNMKRTSGSDDDPIERKQEVAFVVEHSKVSPDGYRGSFELFLDEGEDHSFAEVNDFRAMYYRGLMTGLIVQENGHLMIADQRFNTQSAIREMWRNDPATKERHRLAMWGKQ